MEDWSGKTIGRYRVEAQIGKGGMALVYRAHDTLLEREVAMKVISDDDVAPAALERMLVRFEREAKALARLDHPHIIKVFDYGRYEGTPYLVMQLVPGGTLRQRLEQPLDWRQAVRLAAKISRALAYAHSQGVLHRDVKPSNILITSAGEPLLSDFGIAKILEDERGFTLTGTNVGLGTAEYMAPEQWRGKPVAASDQYSLGVVLYEMLTRRRPYTAETPMEIAIKQATEPVAPPRLVAPGLPEEVERILLQMLAREPANRYEAMDRLAEDLEKAALDQPASRDEEGTVDHVLPDLASALVECPVCGRTNRQEQTFRCKQCGRAGLCLAHQDKRTYLCADCQAQNEGAHPVQAEQRPARSDAPVKQVRQPEETLPRLAVQKERSPGQVTLAPGVVMEFVCVPAGEFLMGSGENDADGLQDERPQRKVYLDEFWIGRYPVTNRQYQVFVKATDRRPPDHWRGGAVFPGKEDHPVVYVSWEDAIAFCEWLESLTRRHIYLPSEAQWEKAARGIDGRKYPWGGQNPDSTRCNFKKLVGDTTPVGSYSPQGDSPYGAADMAGNVWEWVYDWYDDNAYRNLPARNPTGPHGGIYRILRGGSWTGNARTIRPALRSGDFPSIRVLDLGFRCAKG